MSTKAQHGPTARRKAPAAPLSPDQRLAAGQGATPAARAAAQRTGARAHGGGQNRGLTVLTAEVEGKILAGIRDAGMSLRTACAYAGISDDTLVRRRKADPKLAERVEHAQEMFKAKMVTLISAAAPKNWNAAAWLLERKYPEEFGRQRLEITGSAGAPVTIDAEMRAAAAIRRDPEAMEKISEGIGLAIAAGKKRPA